MNVQEYLLKQGFHLTDSFYTSLLFSKKGKQIAVIIDTDLYTQQKPNFKYHEYIGWQNKLMHKFERLFRFVDNRDSEDAMLVDAFLNNTIDEYDFRQFGADRQVNETDPTLPEYNFESLFEQVYGSKFLQALEREYQYVDVLGKGRYVDYMLKTEHCEVAIELNGEAFHHPLFINKAKYTSQLLKQNSLVKDGIKVYRWSNAGMADEKKFADQIRLYFGDEKYFSFQPSAHQYRDITFSLYKHQKEALNDITKGRVQGKNTFLLVLPTGTGKTEVFIADHAVQRYEGNATRALVIVPFRDLREQTKKRFLVRNPQILVSSDIEDSKAEVIVQTTQAIQMKFSTLPQDYFDYIVVDEAHHAPAQGLKRVLSHFTPKTLIGCTATDKRLDQKDLAEIFGRYQLNLSLEDAIKQKLLPTIRAFRLQSNIDFSEVRFNGKEFVKSDLNRKIILPSRDQLIVDMLSKYFMPSEKNKSDSLIALQGVIFCVDVEHANRLAKLLLEQNISAKAVSSNNRSGLEEYKNGQIRFLCACDLLNEGWDAPNTSIVVMARPTMSKVLYMQQLGRGTRNHPGKAALYAIDVVDSYGPALQPWSLHSLFKLDGYKPFADVFNPNQQPTNEELVLDYLYENERRLEPIKLFNFEEEFGDYLNDEQLARALFVSTGTIKSWVKNKTLVPDKQLPFGNHMLNYYDNSNVESIRKAKQLKARSEETRRDDFFEFLEQRDYTFSFKIVFLLLMLKHADTTGEVNLTFLVEDYQAFYISLLEQHGKAEKANSPLNNSEYLKNSATITKSILQNPFEKFERKSFMYHSKELNKIAFDPVLWDKLENADIDAAKQHMLADGDKYFLIHLGFKGFSENIFKSKLTKITSNQAS